MTAIKIGERYRAIYHGDVEGVATRFMTLGHGSQYVLKLDDGTFSNWLFSEQMAAVIPSFSNGDVVKLTSPDGKNLIEGPVFEDIWTGTHTERVNIRLRLDAGWSLEVVERAPKPLPTEPGLYVRAGGNPELFTKSVFRLDDAGVWSTTCDGEGLDEAFVRRLGDLTRLVPEVSA